MESFAIFVPPRWQQLSSKRALRIISRFAEWYRKTKNISNWNSFVCAYSTPTPPNAIDWKHFEFVTKLTGFCVSQMTLAARTSSPAATDAAYRVDGFATVTMTVAMDRTKRNVHRQSAIQSNSSSVRRSTAWRPNGAAMENSTVLTDPMREWVEFSVNKRIDRSLPIVCLIILNLFRK